METATKDPVLAEVEKIIMDGPTNPKFNEVKALLAGDQIENKAAESLRGGIESVKDVKSVLQRIQTMFNFNDTAGEIEPATYTANLMIDRGLDNAVGMIDGICLDSLEAALRDLKGGAA